VSGPKRGTTISFRLTRAVPVTLVFARVRNGHRQSIGRLTIRGAHAGLDKVRFTGRIRGKALAPGRYVLVAAPAHGHARTVSFTVLRAPRHRHR
jgi:hypothetical protein